MELRVLKYFLAVVREENISRAAQLLHMTQPTLSRQLAQLEEELDAQLFIRGKRLTLTEEGMMLRRRAEEVVQLVDKIGEEFQGMAELAGMITIGCGGQASASLVLQRLEEFHRLYPQVTFEIYTNNADNIKEKLERGLLDFGVLLEPVEVEKYNYCRMEVADQWGILMRPDSKLAEQNFVTTEDLMGLPLITTGRQSLQEEIRSWLGGDIEKLHIVATYNIITNAAKLVADGVAYALTIRGAVDLFDPEKLVFRPLQPELCMTSVLAWKRFNPIFGVAGRFLEYFKSTLNT